MQLHWILKNLEHGIKHELIVLMEFANIWHSWTFLKIGNLIISWVGPTLFYKHSVPERQSSQSDKIWNPEDFKNPDFSTLYWIVKNLEVQPSFIIKKNNFPSFSRIRKNGEVQHKQHQKTSKSLFEVRKTRNWRLRPT